MQSVQKGQLPAARPFCRFTTPIKGAVGRSAGDFHIHTALPPELIALGNLFFHRHQHAHLVSVGQLLHRSVEQGLRLQKQLLGETSGNTPVQEQNRSIRPFGLCLVDFLLHQRRNETLGKLGLPTVPHPGHQHFIPLCRSKARFDLLNVKSSSAPYSRSVTCCGSKGRISAVISTRGAWPMVMAARIFSFTALLAFAEVWNWFMVPYSSIRWSNSFWS